MELGLIFYWVIFYSALAGWYSRTAPIIRNDSSIDFKRYMRPRIMLSHVLAGYFIVSIFNFFSLLHDNIWVLVFPILSTLIATEYFWITLSELRKKIAETLTIKIGLVALGVMILFYFSSVSSTYLELLTKVPSGVFGPFENLLTFALSSAAWIVLAQFSLAISSLIYTVKLFINKYDYIENLLFILVSSLASSFFLVLATQAIFSNAIPYIIDNYFVSNMYHSNEGLDKKVICTNRPKNEQLVLLPSGGISIATLNDEKEWVFTVDICERKVNNASQSGR